MKIKREKSTQINIIKDLEHIYEQALSHNNLNIALKVKEIQLRETREKTQKNTTKIKVEDLTDDIISDLIHQLNIYL